MALVNAVKSIQTICKQLAEKKIYHSEKKESGKVNFEIKLYPEQKNPYTIEQNYKEEFVSFQHIMHPDIKKYFNESDTYYYYRTNVTLISKEFENVLHQQIMRSAVDIANKCIEEYEKNMPFHETVILGYILSGIPFIIKDCETTEKVDPTLLTELKEILKSLNSSDLSQIEDAVKEIKTRLSAVIEKWDKLVLS
jgi:hypothetical protein